MSYPSTQVESVALQTFPSTLYDGGDTNNALQLAVNETAVVALTTAPDDFDLDVSVNAIRVFLMNTTGGQAGKLAVGQYNADGDLLEVYEQSFAVTDQDFDTDQDAWGLTAGTDKAAKQPVSISFKRHDETATLRLWMSDSDGGTWYVRYQLDGSL